MGLFREEARESLATLGAGALRVERGEDDRALLDELFRAAHTIKGGARMMALPEIADLAEAVESQISALREGRASVGFEIGSALVGGIDALARAIFPEVL